MKKSTVFLLIAMIIILAWCAYYLLFIWQHHPQLLSVAMLNNR